MNVKLIVKAVAKTAELMLTLWAVGACVGAGMRAGAKADDWFEKSYWDAVKSHEIKRCQRKIQKLSKKELLTEDEKKQQKDLLAEQMWWTQLDTRYQSVLGTTVEGSFKVYNGYEEAQS